MRSGLSSQMSKMQQMCANKNSECSLFEVQASEVKETNYHHRTTLSNRHQTSIQPLPVPLFNQNTTPYTKSNYNLLTLTTCHLLVPL